MSDSIHQHTGSKYIRRIVSCDAIPYNTINVDVYSVLEAFAVVNPGIQHAIKKLLCAGIRGKGDCVQDLKEARDALSRAIQIEEAKLGTPTTITNLIQKSQAIPGEHIFPEGSAVDAKIREEMEKLQNTPLKERILDHIKSDVPDRYDT